MIQGSILPSFVARRMEKTDGIVMSPKKDCLLVPPVFTKGKSKIEKEEAFHFITADKIQLFENVATVEWNPELLRQSAGMFMGTQNIGPSDLPQPLRGYLVAARDFNIRDIEWLAKIWIHD